MRIDLRPVGATAARSSARSRRPQGAKATLKGAARLQNTKRTVTRSGKGKVTLRLKSAKRLSRSQKVVVEIRSGTAQAKVTLRQGKATTSKLAIAVKR